MGFLGRHNGYIKERQVVPREINNVIEIWDVCLLIPVAEGIRIRSVYDSSRIRVFSRAVSVTSIKRAALIVAPNNARGKIPSEDLGRRTCRHLLYIV